MGMNRPPNRNGNSPRRTSSRHALARSPAPEITERRCAPRPTLTLQDTYYDSSDWMIFRAGSRCACAASARPTRCRYSEDGTRGHPKSAATHRMAWRSAWRCPARKRYEHRGNRGASQWHRRTYSRTGVRAPQPAVPGAHAARTTATAGSRYRSATGRGRPRRDLDRIAVRSGTS